MERTNDLIIESDNGFATYRYVNDGRSVYIIDIYSSPDIRRTGTASYFADAICKEAKEKGCTEVLGSVVPSAKGSTLSLQVLLGYGMQLSAASNDFILFRKDL